MKQKYYLALTTEEWRLMIESLNNLRNRLISEGRYTDAVNEVLIKVANTDIYESTGFSAAHIMYIIRALLDKYDIEWSDFAYSARSTKPSGKEEQ